MDSIDGLLAILKAGVGRWEEVVFQWACDLAKNVAQLLLQGIDQYLMRNREDGLSVVGFRKRWITTLFGDIQVKRRLYRDGSGANHFLLDEALGLRKRSQASSKVEELATFLSTLLPFGKCEQLLGVLLPDGLSHTTVHRLVGRTVDPHVEEEERELTELFEDGVLPQSENRAVPHLMVEADGTFVALQREEERRTEVKVGIAYEGWQAVGKDRYRVKEKTSYTGIMSGKGSGTASPWLCPRSMTCPRWAKWSSAAMELSGPSKARISSVVSISWIVSTSSGPYIVP